MKCSRERAFPGDDISEILAAVIKTEPDWQALPAATPPRVRDLLRRCLQKYKTLRLRDAGDAQIEIQEAIAAPKDSSATQTAPASTSKLPWAVAAALVIATAVMGFGWWRSRRPVEQAVRPLVRLHVDLGPDVSLGSPYGADEFISPDGTRLVYVSQGRRRRSAHAHKLSAREGILPVKN